VRAALRASPEGAPLVVVAPKQATYLLERQLLADGSVAGYTRLEILSFEGLARFVFRQLQQPAPDLLSEEGRLMVLRALLARKRGDLRLFRASARLTGFAQQLSEALRSFQQSQITPERLNQLAGEMQSAEGLALKLQDLATLLRDYLEWLKAHKLQDGDCLLAAAAEALNAPPPAVAAGLRTSKPPPLRLEHLWMDGFAELSPQELELLAAVTPHCQQATLLFCLDDKTASQASWLSNWSVVRKTFDRCKERLAKLANVEVAAEALKPDPDKSRFADNAILLHL